MRSRARLLPDHTFEDYCSWEGRWELIEGIPYAMSPSPSPNHQKISGKIHSLLIIAMEEIGCDCDVYQPIDLKISEKTVLNPDLSIVCKPIENQYLDFPPALVVEILSPSTRLKDLHTKYKLYEEFGILHYLVVDPDSLTVELHKLDNNGKYNEADLDFIDIHDDCRITIDYKKIWG